MVCSRREASVCTVIAVVEYCTTEWSLLGRSTTGLGKRECGCDCESDRWESDYWGILITELWAVYEGLRHAWELGFKRLVIEIDNNDVASICNGSSTTLAQICKERNRFADKFATLGRVQDGTVYALPPSAMTVIVVDEKRWWEEQLSVASYSLLELWMYYYGYFFPI
ncbi:hypothetical protein GQ457_04G017300 [Hibiscus cannabinus]